MRRLFGWVLIGAGTAALIAAVGMWVRSYWRMDTAWYADGQRHQVGPADWVGTPPTGVRTLSLGHAWVIKSDRGRLLVFTDRSVISPKAGWRYYSAPLRPVTLGVGPLGLAANEHGILGFSLLRFTGTPMYWSYAPPKPLKLGSGIAVPYWFLAAVNAVWPVLLARRIVRSAKRGRRGFEVIRSGTIHPGEAEDRR